MEFIEILDRVRCCKSFPLMCDGECRRGLHAILLHTRIPFGLSSQQLETMPRQQCQQMTHVSRQYHQQSTSYWPKAGAHQVRTWLSRFIGSFAGVGLGFFTNTTLLLLIENKRHRETLTEKARRHWKTFHVPVQVANWRHFGDRAWTDWSRTRW